MADDYWIPDAKLTTAKTVLDLLALEAPFMQLYLLTANDFVSAAADRGFRLTVQHLEELHRVGVLIPFYQVSLESTPRHRRVPAPRTHDPIWLPTTSVELFASARDRRLADPADVVFEGWPTDRRRSLWPGVATGYLYSHHQLLGLEQARGIVGQLRPRRLPDGDLGWQLLDKDSPDETSLAALQTWRSLAVVLSMLDTPFWPDITNIVSSSVDVWRSARLAFDAADALDWLNVTETEVREQADHLLFTASSDDVLGDFYDLVRRANPSSWKSLRGPARVGMDARMSAELLWRWIDDLGKREPAHPQIPIARQRLSERPASLDSVLTRLRLSPQPAVVVGLEGDTEMRVMPRVLELLGIPNERTWVVLVDFGGTTKDLSLLARYAAEPLLGEAHGDSVLLERPVTRFLVLTDAEELYKTEGLREKQRTKLLNSITQRVPIDLRGDLLKRENALVDIHTWGRYPFEFAHFTDRELATALLAVAKPVTFPGGVKALTAAVAAERATDTPNIKDVWPRLKISKPKFADAMWPVLRRKIKRAVKHGRHGPPIMRGAVRAYELALRDVGKSIVLRRETPPSAS